MNDLSSGEDFQHPVVRYETCTIANVRRIAAMLDLNPDAWSEGDPLPRGWQFILLGADTKRSDLRKDGFPGLGVPLPDLGLPRLMLGGRTVHYHGDIRIGATLRRVSHVKSITHKETRNGPMALVSVALFSYWRKPKSRFDRDARLCALRRAVEERDSAQRYPSQNNSVRRHQERGPRRNIVIPVFRVGLQFPQNPFGPRSRPTGRRLS